MDADALEDPAYDVPAVADGSHGVAWLRANVARFSRGDAHTRRRAIAVAALTDIEPEQLRTAAERDGGEPVAVLAAALGMPDTVADDVKLVAACYQPHVPVTVEADEAVSRLVDACGGAHDEATANRIGLLVQSCDATAALVANRLAGRTDPPVPITRRVGPDGELVEVDLRTAPFGAGPHACPGREHAIAIADGLVEHNRRQTA